MSRITKFLTETGVKRLMTIIEAIITVMKDADRPLTPKEAYGLIEKKGLYSFKAQNPLGVVTGQIRRHCRGLDFPTAENRKYFRTENNGKFFPLPKPIRIGPPGRQRTKGNDSALEHSPSPLRSLSSTFTQIRELQDVYRKLLKERIVKELKKVSPEAFEHFSLVSG